MKAGPSARVPVAVAAFVALGMPEVALSVAWPDVARELDRSIGDLGTVLLVHAVGFGGVAVFTGRLLARFGIASMVEASTLVGALAFVGVATTSNFWVLLAMMWILGASSAALDAGLNTYAALEMDARALNFMHSGFGLGAAIGPWLMTAALITVGWRPGTVVIAVITALPALAFRLTRPLWRIEPREPAAGPIAGRRIDPKVMGLIVAVFILYSGAEVGTGSWAFSLLSEGRGIEVGLAGFAAGAFWAALTASRAVMGFAGGRWHVRRVVFTCGTTAVAALGLMWWAPTPWAGITGLVVAGLALGPLFPLHTSLTASRVGRRATQSVIGFQLAAAVSGGAIIPWAMGRAVEWSSLEVIGPILLVSAAGMIAADLLLERSVRRRPEPTG